MADLSFLKKKELGLPMWAWAIIVAVIMLVLYRHFKNSSGANSQTPVDATSQATPADSGTAGDLGGGSGGGSLGGATDTSGALSDTVSNLAAKEAADYQALFDQLQGNAQGNPGPGNITPAPTASTNGLEWDGTTFKSRADFNAYLKSKGLSVKQFAARHPAAYAIYLALPSGVSRTSAPKSSVLGSATKAAGKVTSGLSSVLRPKYKTLKDQVKLTAGQTVHYTPGKGYFAAPGIPHPSRSRSSIVSPQTRAPIGFRYNTYKTQVRLGQGQKLHYTKGRGYYGA